MIGWFVGVTYPVRSLAVRGSSCVRGMCSLIVNLVNEILTKQSAHVQVHVSGFGVFVSQDMTYIHKGTTAAGDTVHIYTHTHSHIHSHTCTYTHTHT